MKRALAALITVAALAAPLTACSSQSKNVSGTVIDKETDHECKTKKKNGRKTRSCHTEYELTIRTKSGDKEEVDVSSDAYDKCTEGAAYPKCTKN
ncbi:MAG: hypothetical protein HOV73_24590 [Streptomyces sp.]|nr:hypothetical protein [Streptomyces sp.]NUS25958.1 hypothetical protein [Streptomyces sp.]